MAVKIILKPCLRGLWQFRRCDWAANGLLYRQSSHEHQFGEVDEEYESVRIGR